MKAIVFTLDALFALMIAAAGITVILYFVYSTPTPTVIQYSSSSAFVTEAASIKFSSVSGIPLVQQVTNQSQAFNQSWPQMTRDAQNSGGNQGGPPLYSVAYTVNVPYTIMNGTLTASYGNIYFGAGNAIYAMNATTGNILWISYAPYNAAFALSPPPKPQFATPAINATAVYDGMLIYQTTSNTVALNAFNGSIIWSEPTIYTNEHAGDIEPDDDEPTMHLALSNGKIISGSSDEYPPLDPVGYPVYALFARNGTVAGEASAFPYTNGGYGTHIAVYDDEIATVFWSPSLVPAGSNELELITPIYNNSYAGASLSSGASTTSILSNIAVYGNVIAVGVGTNANLYPASNVIAPFSSKSTTTQTTGVTSFQGHFVFQSYGDVSAYNPTGTQLWLQSSSLPAAMQNSTPIQSSHNVYAIWSKGWVSEENLSNGAFLQSVQIPYSTTFSSSVPINPNMMLAYGKLFASEGSNLIAFGTCQVDSNSSILTALGTMYINNEGSCADSILSSLQSNLNSSFTVNNQTIITTSSFNGANSLVDVPYSSTLDLKGPFSVSLWFSSNAIQSASFDSELIDSRQPVDHTFDLQLVQGGANPGIHGDIGTGAAWLSSSILYPFNVVQNRWYNLVGVYTTTGWTLYLNGNAISASYSSGTPDLLGAGSNLYFGGGTGASAFNGLIASVQIYNASLTSQQAGQIYRDGISGAPVISQNATAWFPLAGDANGYNSEREFPGFDSQVSFLDASYTPIGALASYSISSQTLPAVLLNYTTGKYSLYTLGLYSWK